MAKRKLLDSKGNEIRGLYYDELKNGRNIYARFKLRKVPQWVNLTKEFGITSISKAKEQRNKLLAEYTNPDADFIKSKVLVNDLIEAYIEKRPENKRYPNRSQKKIVYNRYELHLKPFFQYVTVGKLSNKHILKVKAHLDKRGVGAQTYQKLRTLIRASLKGTGVNFEKLFNDFEAKEANTQRNQKKLKIDEYFKGYDLEEVAQGFYSEYSSLLTKAKTPKEQDRYAFLLYLLLTASRVGEVALLQVKHVEVFDERNNILRVIVPKSTNKNNQTREVMVPRVITSFIKNRISTANDDDYLFVSSIENVIPYHFKKSLKQFSLTQTHGLQVHIFRSLFRNIAIDRELNVNAIDYIMDRQRQDTVDRKFYDARLTKQQRYNVFKLASTYEKICNGEIEKMSMDYSDI